MSIILTQHITRYYEEYSSLDVTFTKDIIKTIRLVPKQIFLKCAGYQWPCIIYSSSMISARIIANANLPIKDVAQKANNSVSLHMSFRIDKSDPVSFFISARISGFSPFGASNPDLNIIALTFTQRPADDLIVTLGQILEANATSQKRKDERIIMTPEVRSMMGIAAKETALIVQGVPRKGIIRDLSFSGAKVIIAGVAKFLVGKPVTVNLELEDTGVLEIEGTIPRFEPVEGRKDISAFAIQFTETSIPLRYKMIISDYLKVAAKNKRVSSQQAAPAPRPAVENPPPAAPKAPAPETPPKQAPPQNKPE